MARGGGSAKPGCVYHLISRFVAREFFIQSAVERETYLSLLGFMIARSDWRCFSYAIMSNHIHLGLVAGDEPLAEWLRPTHTHFAQWINQRRERIGAVFVKGPNFIEVMRHGAPHVINYIHQNPVRAGVVADARDSDWTSHRAYLGLTRKLPWLDVELGLELAGFANGLELEACGKKTRVERDDLDLLRVRNPRVPRRKAASDEAPQPGARTEECDRTANAVAPAASHAATIAPSAITSTTSIATTPAITSSIASAKVDVLPFATDIDATRANIDVATRFIAIGGAARSVQGMRRRPRAPPRKARMRRRAVGSDEGDGDGDGDDDG